MQTERAQQIFEILKHNYPDAKCALIHNSAWQLLMATILSAQCTDERVNKVTPIIWQKYPTVQDVNNMDIEELKKLIYTTGFYNNKSKNIKGAAKRIVEEFNGEVPDNMKDLLTIPGVARKTANVVLGNWFKKNEGVVVDTHIWRLSRRLGLTIKDNPINIEKDLMKLFPQENWERIGTYLVMHGRKICKARKPDCAVCPLNKICPSAFKV